MKKIIIITSGRRYKGTERRKDTDTAGGADGWEVTPIGLGRYNGVLEASAEVVLTLSSHSTTPSTDSTTIPMAPYALANLGPFFGQIRNYIDQVP